MKPQLVVTDMSGRHAENLPETADRLQRGGSWKKQRIVLILPSADVIAAKVMLAYWSLAFPPNNGVVKILALGDEVGVAYSKAIDGVLAHPQLKDFEYILTLEHDNAPPSDGVLKLVERMEENPEYAAISGLYFTKGPGGVAQIWGDPEDPVLNFRPQVPRLDGSLQRCWGIPMGFALWRLEMFRDANLPRPLFRTVKGYKQDGGFATQDLNFWNEAAKLGYRCAVDTSVKVGHYDLKGEAGIEDCMW